VAALLAGACSAKDPMAGEIACQQRMVAVPAAPNTAPRGHGLGNIAVAFGAMSRRYAAMPLDGCTDDQRARATMLVKETSGIAADAASLPDVQDAPEPSLQARGKFLTFVSRLEGFERRRQIMQQDLEKMRAVRLR
jgi:hypothetical protein